MNVDTGLSVIDVEEADEFQHFRPAPAAVPGAVLGTLVDWDSAGNPLVDYPDNPGADWLVARSTIPLAQAALNQEVALLFLDGDPRQPLVIGLLQKLTPRPPIEAKVDDDRLVISAAREIVLQCGEASLTLTRAGKVLIRGHYVLTRSSGLNRIKGGSVQIN